MADEKKYLEGNYDGEPVQQAVQMTVDVVRAVNMPEEIRAVQEAVYEKETERLSYEEKATGERFEELMRNYIEEDKYHQYLVDGAVLRCTAATTDDFTYAEGETVVLENKDDEACNITLDVHENPMSVNHLIYATVKDTVQQVNITPPKCNCRLAVNRNAERKRIADDMERNKNGVCRHLMDLNGTWDNFEVGNTAYLKKVNAIINLFPSEDGEGLVEGPGDIIGEEDGITMTSVLFCKHGGLIMPVTSGQENVEPEQKLYMESPDPSDQQAVKEYIWNYFRAANFSEAATAAILGNICAETGGYKADINDNGRYGLFQYIGDRKNVFLTQVKEWAKEDGITDLDNAWKNVELQCRFALEEFNKPEGHGWSDRGILLTANGRSFDMFCTRDKFLTEEDPSVAALMWAASFERCYSGKVLNKEGKIYFTELQGKEKRYDEAARVYEELKK